MQKHFCQIFVKAYCKMQVKSLIMLLVPYNMKLLAYDHMDNEYILQGTRQEKGNI